MSSVWDDILDDGPGGVPKRMVHADPHATEVAAAKAVLPRAGSIRAKVYSAVKVQGDHGLTAAEFLDANKAMRHSTARTRFTELRDRGLIVESGKTRENEKGNEEIVWVVGGGDPVEKASNRATRRELEKEIERLRSEARIRRTTTGASMNVIWISEHGEVVEEETTGAICIEEVGVLDSPDKEWLGDWLTKQDVHLTAEEKALKAQHKKLMGRIAARRKYLAFAYDERIKAVVREKMKETKTKKKTVDFAYGKAGWRTSTSTEITDMEKAIAWARKNAPDAIKQTPDSLLVSQLPNKAVVPGVLRKTGSTFSVKGSKA